MDFTDTFTIHATGEVTGQVYTGTFVVKTVLTRADAFAADQRRREILGSNSNDALEALKLEAFMLGQLYVRIIKAPPFWENSQYGLLLEDFNIINLLFQKCMEAANKHQENMKKRAQEALESLRKKEEPPSASANNAEKTVK